METKDMLHHFEIKLKSSQDIVKQTNQDAQMTSSTISTVSSLTSPVDSGVQLLDSESELTSNMSVSGFGCDVDIPNLDSDFMVKDQEVQLHPAANLQMGTEKDDCIPEKNTHSTPKEEKNLENKVLYIDDNKNRSEMCLIETVSKINPEMIRVIESGNKPNKQVAKELSMSVPNYFDKYFAQENSPLHLHKLTNATKSLSDEVFEMEHPIKSTINNIETDSMNISLNSYELLDYTLQNINLDVPPETTDMHVSMSEEVNENLKILMNSSETAQQPLPEEPIQVVEDKEGKPAEEQIVFRRQRKKKTKSDTPKKRVSFHEDILNSTKIDDIHINHGFITHEPDVSLSFFQRGFIRKPDVVKGRYSWAAEGDAPYYEKTDSNREIKSDIYLQNKRFSSTSSSSTGSISSSIDEEDNSDENLPKKEPSQKLPKSSCLKKTKHNRKYINTNVVQEETNLKAKKSETNLLDSNIFGSLKNILSFSTSVPLAERGVPEGQEDITVYSSSHDSSSRRKSGNLSLKNFETVEIKPANPVNTLSQAKNNLKLTRSEGFYPNYPTNPELPANIIICDSNVYEHKGISYSYEYDNFQKSFEQQNKPKSSTVYQMILKEFNFFRRKAKEEPEKEAGEDFEIVQSSSTPIKIEDKSEEVKETEIAKSVQTNTKNPINNYASSTKLDWSDNETVSDFSESNSRHLSSPKRKINRNNHYTVQQSFKASLNDARANENELENMKPLTPIRAASSKTSLINRFLRNVTLKKMIDAKIQNKLKNTKCMYIKNIKPPPHCNDDINKSLENEIILGKEKQKTNEVVYDKKMIINFRKGVFRTKFEKLLRVLPVRSAYTTDGNSKPLLALITNSTLYITSTKNNNSYTNYFVLPYTELNTILIGPNAQTIHFSNYDKDMQFIISTGCSNVTSELVGQLEIAMRRDDNKPRLPAVKQLTMADMTNLRRAICKQTSVDKSEDYYYYSIVSVQDFVAESAPTPLGTIKEGPLMFKTSDADSARWETAYFILKAGVLYMLSSASQRVPMKVFPLINGSCQGARRVFNSHRPHTFQLIIENKSLLLAAPDEYVASEWLQELIHGASGIYNVKDKSSSQACSLLMTSDHILTVREVFPFTMNNLLPSQYSYNTAKGTCILSCATIVDLTAFRLPSAEQSWCILEFSCREVHECSGDWVLYFASNAELESFISSLEMLWQYNNENGDSFPLSTIPDTDPLSKKCVDVYTSLLGTWATNTVLLQFL